MTPAFSARRRADEFESLVSSIDPAPLTERDARDFAALLALVDDLRAVPEVTARPAFVADLRAELMAAAETALVPARDVDRKATPSLAPPRDTRRQRRLSVLLGGAALVGATATAAVAAQTALPGESLYPVKRGIESAQLQFVSGPDRGRAQLANAGDRLTELEALAAQGRDARVSALAADTLETFTEQADEGGDLLLSAYAETDDRDLVAQVYDFNVSSMGRLSELKGVLPEDTVDAVTDAAKVLIELDRDAAEACVACSGGLVSLPVPRGLDIGLDAVRTAQALPGLPGSGQEVDGLEIPELEVPPLETPDDDMTSDLPLPVSPSSPNPTKAPGKVLPETTEKVEETLKGTGETLEDVGETVKDPVGTLEETGEVVEEVTGTVGGVTEGAVDDVTRWLDYLGQNGTEGGTTPPELLPDAPLP